MSRRRNTSDESPNEAQGAGETPGQTARVMTGDLVLGHDPRTLARRLPRGAIAVVDAVDLDAASAEALADRRPVAVINLSASVTGRFEARGAALLLRRGVPLYDAADRRLLAADDAAARIEDGGATATVRVGEIEAELRPVTEAAVAATVAGSQASAALRVPLLAASALDVVQRDGAAIVSGTLAPGLAVDLEGKDVLVVGAGAGYRSDLKAVRRAVKDKRMAVICTGDAAVEVAASHGIDVLIGPFESVPDDVLRKAKAVVVHGESHAVASTRLGALGVAHAASESRLESADLGVALAASAGARLIVSAGRPSSLAGLLDGPSGASALVARLAAGGAWVDAQTFASLYRPRWSRIAQWLWIVVAVGALGAALSLHPSVRDALAGLWGGS